ncbi:hypothetical protein C5167_026804 [Papaver somniferum]|nr:hypothetical protein C5167_026804 [Papaver somniferum]
MLELWLVKEAWCALDLLSDSIEELGFLLGLKIKKSHPKSLALDVYKEDEELLKEEPHMDFSGEVPSPTSYCRNLCTSILSCLYFLHFL